MTKKQLKELTELKAEKFDAFCNLIYINSFICLNEDSVKELLKRLHTLQRLKDLAEASESKSVESSYLECLKQLDSPIEAKECQS